MRFSPFLTVFQPFQDDGCVDMKEVGYLGPLNSRPAFNLLDNRDSRFLLYPISQIFVISESKRSEKLN